MHFVNTMLGLFKKNDIEVVRVIYCNLYDHIKPYNHMHMCLYRTDMMYGTVF